MNKHHLFICKSIKFLICFIVGLSIIFSCISINAYAGDQILQWDKNDDADYYIVYWRTTEQNIPINQSKKIPANITSINLEDSDNGQEYYYSVKAFNAFGNSSDLSKEVMTAHFPVFGTAELMVKIILPEHSSTRFDTDVLDFSCDVYTDGSICTNCETIWTSGINGILGTGIDIESKLLPGNHIITATVSNPNGKTGVDTILVSVEKKNEPPVIQVFQTGSGASNVNGQVVYLEGIATNTEGLDLSDRIIWYSNINGSIGTGAKIQPTLSSGQHTITAKVTDDKNKTGIDTLNIAIEQFNDNCPNDPDKTEPGECGCGVPEGTCSSYPLTVTNGSGDESYKPGSTVTINANTAPSGKVFDHWVVISGNPSIANFNTSTTTLTMPTTVAAVTATYKTMEETLHYPENPTDTVNGLEYKYYHGTWNLLPNYNALTPVKTGTTNNFSLNEQLQSNYFGFMFMGYVNVPTDGTYTFYTSSDDGSKLYIGTDLVVNNDGLHGKRERSGQIGLKAGKHAVRVDFFEKTGAANLAVRYAGPGISKQLVPNNALYRVSPQTTYNLTVNSGNGDGSYPSGATVTVIANATLPGKVFDRWIVNSGNTEISMINAPSTSLTMQSNVTTVTATYKDTTTSPTLSLFKTTYAVNEKIVVQYTNLPGNWADWISIFKAGTLNNQYMQWFYTKGAKSGTLSFNGLPPGQYDVRLFFKDSYNLEHKVSFTVKADSTKMRM